MGHSLPDYLHAAVGTQAKESRTCDQEEGTVGIGGSIFLIALGAILAWAVHFHIGWLDLRVVGWVFMVAGLSGLLLTLWFWSNRRRQVTMSVPVRREVPVHREVPVQRERIVEDDEPIAPPERRY
jgi:uncharacterized iron-regulated membrane protein